MAKKKVSILVGGPNGQTIELSGMVEQDKNQLLEAPQAGSDEQYNLLDQDPKYPQYADWALRMNRQSPGMDGIDG